MIHDAGHWTIRPAKVSDAAAMVAVLNPIIAAGIYTAMDRMISVEEQAAFVRAFPDYGIFHVAACARRAEVVGMQDVVPAGGDDHAPRVGAISTFVALDQRRRGVGSALMAATVEAAARKGYRELIATIRSTNAAAIAFYRREGFGASTTPGASAPALPPATDRVVVARALAPP